MSVRLEPLPSLARWDHVFGLGVKCNTAAARKRLGLQTYSSPFDNMDSVLGLRDIARVLSIGSEAYFGARDKWVLRNDYGSRSTEVRTKILYHSDYPGLFYPHFHSRWFDHFVASQLDGWIKDPEGKIDLVWNGVSSTFSRRLDRLVDFLRGGSRISLLRIDEINSLSRIYSSGNTIHDIQFFAEEMARAGFDNFQLLYIYAHSPQFNREGIADGLDQLFPQRLKTIALHADEHYDSKVLECLSSLFAD